jgi:hypothetical protein
METKTGLGHQLQSEQRSYSHARVELEELLLKHIKLGVIKTGDEQYRRYCEIIENYAALEIAASDRYNDNN